MKNKLVLFVATAMLIFGQAGMATAEAEIVRPPVNCPVSARESAMIKGVTRRHRLLSGGDFEGYAHDPSIVSGCVVMRISVNKDGRITAYNILRRVNNSEDTWNRVVQSMRFARSNSPWGGLVYLSLLGSDWQPAGADVAATNREMK